MLYLLTLLPGLVLEKGGDWRVVCRPFPRFFNWHEVPQSEARPRSLTPYHLPFSCSETICTMHLPRACQGSFDWSHFTARAKEDGSFMALFMYDGPTALQCVPPAPARAFQ